MLKQGYFLVKQVLTPFQIRPADHPHDVTAGVQREWARLLLQLHVCFGKQVIPFAPVAGVAASHQVLPG